jgi:hypothetical protein
MSEWTKEEWEMVLRVLEKVSGPWDEIGLPDSPALLAAAPEMLKALENIYRILPDGLLRNEARIAIEKARMPT